MKFLVQIKDHDLTDVPPRVIVIKSWIIDADGSEIRRLRKKFKDAFESDNGIGSYDYLTISVIELN